MVVKTLHIAHGIETTLKHVAGCSNRNFIFFCRAILFIEITATEQFYLICRHQQLAIDIYFPIEVTTISCKFFLKFHCTVLWAGDKSNKINNGRVLSLWITKFSKVTYDSVGRIQQR